MAPPSHMFAKISSISGVSIFHLILRSYHSVLRRGSFDLYNEQNGQNTIDKPIEICAVPYFVVPQSKLARK